jgi:hypothetical protein
VNILDENIIDSQRHRVRQWRIAVRHLGYNMGRQGMKDQEILALLHRVRRLTFLTRDEDFYAPRLCHARYCLVYLAVAKDEVAPFVRRLLRHPEFDTVAKRMGTVVRVSYADLSVRRLHADQAIHVPQATWMAWGTWIQ